MAIALTDQGLAYLLIAATAIHPDQRDAWLQRSQPSTIYLHSPRS